MTEEEFINNQLQALSKSKFRSGFKLKEKEKELNSREAELESKQSLKSSSQQSTK